MLGDCPARSTDSRAWGPLPVESVVARPVVRVWPLDRQGAIDASVPLKRVLLPLIKSEHVSELATRYSGILSVRRYILQAI